MSGKNSAVTFKNAKKNGEHLTMLTAYDYSTAKLMDETGINGILVGDSLGNVILGYEVESTCRQSEYVITGIAGKKGFVSINIEKDMMNSEIGFGRKVLEAFEKHGISFEHMPSGIDTMTIFVHQPEFEGKEQQVLADIHRLAHPDSIEIESDLGLIAVVGRGMKAAKGTAGRIFSALAHARINVKMIDQGSSELNIIIGVKNSDFEKAIKAIYDIFVETQL